MEVLRICCIILELTMLSAVTTGEITCNSSGTVQKGKSFDVNCTYPSAANKSELIVLWTNESRSMCTQAAGDAYNGFLRLLTCAKRENICNWHNEYMKGDSEIERGEKLKLMLRFTNGQLNNSGTFKCDTQGNGFNASCCRVNIKDERTVTLTDEEGIHNYGTQVFSTTCPPVNCGKDDRIIVLLAVIAGAVFFMLIVLFVFVILILKKLYQFEQKKGDSCEFCNNQRECKQIPTRKDGPITSSGRKSLPPDDLNLDSAKALLGNSEAETSPDVEHVESSATKMKEYVNAFADNIQNQGNGNTGL